jgi:hypothetical protein
MAMGDRVSAIAGSESLELPGPGAPTAGAPPPQRSPSSSSGAAGASDATSADAGDDFEELSRRIYERVRLRLRRELLLDRERGGYLTDSR